MHLILLCLIIVGGLAAFAIAGFLEVDRRQREAKVKAMARIEKRIAQIKLGGRDPTEHDWRAIVLELLRPYVVALGSSPNSKRTDADIKYAFHEAAKILTLHGLKSDFPQ
jgi:hypothetical protein